MNRSTTNILLWSWVALLVLITAILPLYYRDAADYFLLPAPLTMILGALILTKVPGNRIGLVMLVGGSAWLIYVIGRHYAQLSLQEGPFPSEYVAARLGNWLGPFFLLSFPTLLVLPGRQGGRVAALVHGIPGSGRIGGGRRRRVTLGSRHLGSHE